MIVLVLVRAKPGLRGHVARWLTEITPGVFVGQVNTRVRAELWSLVVERIGSGEAILIYPHRSEQRWVVEAVGGDRIADADGVTLARRVRKRRNS